MMNDDLAYLFILSIQSIGGYSRDTSIVVIVLETSEVFIIASLSTRSNTQVICIDPTTGSLSHTGKVGHDVFLSEEEAVNYVTDGSRLLCKSTVYGRAVLGYSALGNYGLLLVATKLTATIANLPGGGCVHTVTESQWVRIELNHPQPQGKGEIKNIQELTELDIDGKYFFCETRDITRPFPSSMPLQNPDEEFVWNGWLSRPFKEIGLPAHCVVLLQVFPSHLAYKFWQSCWFCSHSLICSIIFSFKSFSFPVIGMDVLTFNIHPVALMFDEGASFFKLLLPGARFSV